MLNPHIISLAYFPGEQDPNNFGVLYQVWFA